MDTNLLIADVDQAQKFKKNKLISQVITKAVEEKELNPTVASFLSKPQFMGDNWSMAEDVIKRFKDNSPPSIEYLNEKWLFQPSETTMNQFDLASLLKDDYIKENFNRTLFNKIKSLKSSRADIKELTQLIDELRDTLVEVQDVRMASFEDSDKNKQLFNDIKSNLGLIKFKTMKPFNYLEFRLQELEGLMAGSGSGKSLVLEKLQTDLDPDDYVVLHFSLEFPQKLYFKRIVSLLGWVSFSQFDKLNDFQIDELSRKLSREYPNWYYTCLDTDKSSAFNVHKIESLIKYYRNKYGETKPIIVMVDYVQLLDENFDPQSCRVNRDLHSIAVKYNCCIIETIQCNDDASKYDYPPELSMMGFVKSLKNDCDIIQSFKGIEIEGSPEKMIILSKTKKHRNGKHLAFNYEIDFNDNSWTCSSDLTKFLKDQ